MSTINKAVAPAVYPPSSYSNTPEKHYWQTEGACSVKISDMFPSVSEAFYKYGDDIKLIEERTRKSLENVDMSFIKPMDRINITASEHGFGVMGGIPYVAMIRTLRQVIEERTGNYRSRVILAMYRLPDEADEVQEFFDLENELGCEVVGTCPFVDGVAIDTKLGRFYGNKTVYDCDWMIYAYYDDPREQYLHRGMNRLFKSFVMNFGRVETRCSFHMLSSSWNNSIIPTAIYDSEFVQKHWGFATILNMCPNGVRNIFSSRDLYECERESIVHLLRDYTITRLLTTKLPPYIGVYDGGKWACYLHTGGTIMGIYEYGAEDFFDMEKPFSLGKEMAEVNIKNSTNVTWVTPKTCTIQAIVMNQQWAGLGSFNNVKHFPHYCVGKELYDILANDRCNQGAGPGMGYAENFHAVVDTLEEGIEMAMKEVGTTNVLAFDGSYTYMNCSESLAKLLPGCAAGIEEEVYNKLLPKYLKQRGFDVEQVYRDVYHREYKEA